jgi:hypothetical protein
VGRAMPGGAGGSTSQSRVSCQRTVPVAKFLDQPAIGGRKPDVAELAVDGFFDEDAFLRPGGGESGRQFLLVFAGPRQMFADTVLTGEKV